MDDELRSIFPGRPGGSRAEEIDLSELVERDRARRQRVAELLEGGHVQDAEDHYQAAMVFQHGSALEH